MRRLITGVDELGRSCVVEEHEMVTADPGPGHGVRVARVYATTEAPPPARPAGLGATVDVALGPGLVRWSIVEHPPQPPGEPVTSRTMHHTDALNLVFVQSGTIDLELVAGTHTLGPGDCVVLTGVDHAWHAGSEGATLLSVSVGLAGGG